MKTFYYKIIIPILLLLSIIITQSCTTEQCVQLSITNPTNLSLTDAFITADIDSSIKSFSVYEGEEIIPSQLLISDEKKEIKFVLNLNHYKNKKI
jgi:hypothetical protein